MDLPSPFRFLLPLLVILLVLAPITHAMGVFQLHERFPGGRRSLTDLKAHDTQRRARIFSGEVDIALGGSGSLTRNGRYYAEIRIGSPPKKYHVQLDTGSDLMWVRCAECSACPRKSTIKHLKLQKYDWGTSVTGEEVNCSSNLCPLVSQIKDNQCLAENPQCTYSIRYGDGSTTAGYGVTDDVHYDQIIGERQTMPASGRILFGCATEVSGDLVSSNEALDGIIGFGQSNSSMISQLASSGKVRKVFSHCLDSTNGGGIFAIGRVVQPKVKTTPLIPNMPHYNVNMKSIEVGGTFLQLPTDLFETGNNKGTIIDSGTTLAYLPDIAYKQLMTEFLSAQNVNLVPNGEFLCFRYSGSIDDGFPSVTFHFENSLSLMVYPHDYLFQIEDDMWCIGWQSSGKQSKDGEERVLLGDLVLSNKLVVYDLENQVIGWVDYNCSSSVKVQDDKSGAVYSVDAHNISSSTVVMERSIVFLLLTAIMCFLVS